MNGPFLTFMLVPCAAAVAVGWAARHWSLAAAATTGGLAIAILLASLNAPLTTFALPLATGTAIAGLPLILMLLRRPSVSVWNRMMAALGAVFLTHFAFLQYVLAA